MQNRTKILASALLAAVFVAGAVAGGAVSSAWGTRNDGARPRPAHRPGYVEKLSAELTLTPEQVEHVQASLKRRQRASDAVWEAMRPRFDSIRADVRKEIASALTDTQREKFYLMLARSDSIRRAQRDSVARVRQTEGNNGR